MELEAISGAATVALTSTIVFVLVARTWFAATRASNSTSSFSDRILHEAAQRFRDELDLLNGKQTAYLGGALVFAVLFVAAWILDAGALFSGYPSWQLYLQLGFLGLAGGYAAYRLGMTISQRRRVKFSRDANIAIGHQLQQLPAGFARIFHDVPTATGIVDHVLVGQSGIYAVNVIAARSRKRSHARRRDNEIQFANGRPSVSIVNIAARTRQLQKEFSNTAGSNIRVRSVIAVPGWDIGEQSGDDHLLVNERTIAMISGWKDNSDYLMNEDVDAIRNDLVNRCVAA
ncbi:MAG: NERD domain-containing protein [Pseudomonadota bacterium]